MLNWKSSALSLALILAPALYMLAQEPTVRPGRGGADKGITAAIAGAKEDPAAFERGAKAYTQSCAGCHGAVSLPVVALQPGRLTAPDRSTSGLRSASAPDALPGGNSYKA